MTDLQHPTLDATHATYMEAGGEQAFLIVNQGETARLVPLGDGVEVTFGRSRTATVPVESEKVSRLHARIVRRGSQITVEDLESRNGTRVNGTRIEGPTRVGAGDEIVVGPATIVVAVSTLLRRRTRVGSTSDLDERLGAEVDRAARYHRPLALLMLRFDGPADAVDAAIERVASAIRRMDCLAEYTPDELALVLPEATRETAEAAARRVAKEARAEGLTVHVGFATFPEDGPRAGELLSSARAALRQARQGGGAEVAPAPALPPVASDDVVVVDPAMRRVHEMIDKIAATPITLLILGETGVGKEIVAGELHHKSPRRAEPFVRLNCASLPETLLESELFGHERGAFTGADRRKLGYFEAAHGGTLFLDEIGEIPISLQPKLLRVLESRRITRVGGTAEIDVDVRLVCATNRDLAAEIARGRFREDLYFRISAFSLLVPPLRDRRAEILPLAEHFARQFAAELRQPPPRLDDGARRALEAYPWPGNVRELRNAMERAVVLSTQGEIGREQLDDKLRVSEPPRGSNVVDMREHIADVERGAIVAALEACRWNQTQAALRLGISRRALIYKLEKYGLKPPPPSQR